MTFSAHCRDGALRFLHTALVIDDRAEMGSDGEDAAPKTAAKVSSSILGKQAGAPRASADSNLAKRAAAPVSAKASQPDAVPPDAPKPVAAEGADKVGAPAAYPNPGSLNAKALTDAFLSKEIICGVHRPEGETTSVALSVKAATRADIVIVDWLLEGKSSVKAKEIVKQILLADAAEHGRARLVAIYTSEPGRADVAKELFKVLQGEAKLVDRLKLSDDGLTICGVDTRITILNKSGTPQAQDVLAVAEGDLPDHLVDEFVKLTDGLLSNFAVSSVAAIRRGAHHVLALFAKDLDGVYVAHRCSIKNPKEAEDLALELIGSELIGLIENGRISETTLGPDVIDTWLDRESTNRTFSTDIARLPADLLKDLIRKGQKRLAEKEGQMQVGRDAPPKGKIGPTSITTVFYDDEAAARTAARRFSRLSNFKREAGRLRPSDDFRPMLTLGTLLKVRTDLAAVGGDVGCDYLLCMQPICDAVRLEGTTPFPFQTAVYDEKRFNLIVNEAGADGYLNLGLKPRDTVMLRFDRSAGGDTVLAERNEAGDFLFSDAAGRVFQWMGDMASLKAQGFASEIAANQHRVGVDDLEWLRLGAKGAIEPEKK